MTADAIKVEAMYIGTDDATLLVEADEYGDSYTMTLVAGPGHPDGPDHVIAKASGFRPGACQDFGEGHERNTIGTFGAFLGAALEDAEFAASWEVIADDASEWADALAIQGDEEYES